MKQPVRKPLSFDEIEALEDAIGQRYELWHGEPIAMTGGTLKHNLIALGLYQSIYPQLKPGCRVVVADVKLRLSEAADSDAAYPDVMVVCEPLPGSYQTRPVLLAEVLSDSSVRRDRVDKHSAYTAWETDTDREFMARLYASTRTEELAPVPWPEEIKQAFLQSQFELQRELP
jgi:Uma2 family endonuclease